MTLASLKHVVSFTRTYDVIVDNGSCETIVLKSLPKTLELTTIKYTYPYKVGWINQGADFVVNEIYQVLLFFFLW